MTLPRAGFWTPRPLRRAWGKLAPVVIASTEGADWTFKAPPGYVTSVFAVRAKLTTANGEAGNRIPGLRVSDGNHTVLEQFYSGNIAEKVTTTFTWLRDQPFAEQVQGNKVAACSLADIPLLPGWSLASTTAELKAKDTWTELFLYGEQFPLDGPDLTAEHDALLQRLQHLERVIADGPAVYA